MDEIPQFPEENRHDMIDFIIEHETNGDIEEIRKRLINKDK
jgi:hypothetical protein